MLQHIERFAQGQGLRQFAYLQQIIVYAYIICFFLLNRLHDPFFLFLSIDCSVLKNHGQNNPPILAMACFRTRARSAQGLGLWGNGGRRAGAPAIGGDGGETVGAALAA
jgi:hypothetical protein